jgi:hypothetical protein
LIVLFVLGAEGEDPPMAPTKKLSSVYDPETRPLVTPAADGQKSLLAESERKNLLLRGRRKSWEMGDERRGGVAGRLGDIWSGNKATREGFVPQQAGTTVTFMRQLDKISNTKYILADGAKFTEMTDGKCQTR